MIGLALASHTFLHELEDRRCKKLGHRSTPDQLNSQHRHCSRCIEESLKHRKPKSKKLKKFLPNIMFKNDASEKPSKTKSKSPSITSSSSAEFFTSSIASPTSQQTSTPIESPIQRETILAPRAHRLLATRELSTKIYREVYEDRWDPNGNPQGKINLCTAENNLCEDLLEEKLNNPQIWSGAIQSLHHYSQSGGFDWVKQAAINYVEKFISKIGDPGILPENITIVPGCRAAYDMLGFCLFEPGDAILTFVPFYSRLVDNLEERAQVRIIPIEFEDFTNPHLNVDLLKTAFENAEQNGIRVKAISINNPHNPLGYIFSENEIFDVCKWATSKNLFIIADEVFATTISSNNCFRSLLSIRHKLGVKQRKKVIWMWSVSKDLCLPGARFGLIHAENKDLQKGLRRLEIMQPCAPIVQHLIGTLFSDIGWFERFNEIKNARLQDNREFAMSKLNEYEIKYFTADSALFIFINLTEYIENDTYEAEQKLWKRLTRAGIYLNPGCLLSHSTCGWFRMVISVPKNELEEGIKRLHAILLAVEKREIQRKSFVQLEIPSQPISSATSEDELMKLIFPKDAKIKRRIEENESIKLQEDDSKYLLDEVFSGSELSKKLIEKVIENPKLEEKIVSPTISTEDIYATIYDPPTPKSSVLVISNKQPAVHQTSVIKENLANNEENNWIKTTVQELHQEHVSTKFEELSDEIYAPIKGKTSVESQVKVQKWTEPQTTTYISKPQQIQAESRTKSSPSVSLPNEVFESIFKSTPDLSDEKASSTTTVQEFENLKKEDELAKSDLNLETKDSKPKEAKYGTTKHDSGIEMTDYKSNLDSKFQKGENQQISEEHSMPAELYESIFESPIEIEETISFSPKKQYKIDQDSKITTDTSAFLKQQHEVKSKTLDEPTLPENLIDDIFEPKESNFSITEDASQRRTSDGLLEKVFKPSQSLPLISTEKIVSQKSEKDDQITTDFSAFSRNPTHETINKSMPTLSDDVIERIFAPKFEENKSRKLSGNSWGRIFERPTVEESEKTIDYRTSTNDHQITTDMSSFSRHQNLENKRQIGEPTLSNEEVGSILKQLWSESSDEELNEKVPNLTLKDSEDIHKELIVTEVHSPTFTQQFEYVEMQPQQTEDIATLTKITDQLIPEPLMAETKSDDLLDKIFQQQSEFTQNQPTNQVHRIKSNEKDQQINDGLSFPKQISTEKHAISEPTLSDDVYGQIFEKSVKSENLSEEIHSTIDGKDESKPTKVQKHVRIAEAKDEIEAKVENQTDEIEDLEKYGKLIDEKAESSDKFEQKDDQLKSEDQIDEFAKVFEDKEGVNTDDFDDDYSIKPILTDFSFIEELVNESILRRQKQQYRPEMDLWRMSIVEEVSETSATPKGSTGSPISRRSLRGSIKEKSTTTESPLNEDIFKSSEINESIEDVFKNISEDDKVADKNAQKIVDDVFQNLSISPDPHMEPLHIDVHNEPLQSSTLKRGQFNDNRLYETNDSGIGMDVSSGGSLTIEFPLLYTSQHEESEKPIFSSEELNKMLEEPLDHWPSTTQPKQQNRPKFESLIQQSTQPSKKNLLKSEDSSSAQTPPIYSEADIWSILGKAQERQSQKGAKRQILKKKQISESSDETSKLTSSVSSESLIGNNSVNLNVKLRSFSPSPLNSSQSNEAINSTPTKRQKFYQKRRTQRSQSSKIKSTQQEPSFTGIIDSYNNSLKKESEIFPKVCVTSHHRYKKATIVQSLSRSEDPLLPETSQIHHKMYMERRPKSHSPRRQVIIEHTNITEVAYDSKSDLTDVEKPEIIKTKASTRINSLGTNELLNSLVFDTTKEPSNEKAERYVEIRRQKLKDQIRTSKLIVKNDGTSSADDSTDFTRTKSGRIQRGIQTRDDPLDLCCKLRLVQKTSNEEKNVNREFVMCKNPSHSEKHDHCNPKRLYIVKRSTIPKNAAEHSNAPLSPDPNDILKVSNSSDSTSSNSIDRVTVRHTPGSKWIVSSICKTTKFGFNGTPLESKQPGFPPIRSKLYKNTEPSGPHSD